MTAYSLDLFSTSRGCIPHNLLHRKRFPA
jgi:hypothetical protein